MPKNRKVVKKDGVIKVINVPAKLRIGTRKAGKSAHSMKTQELFDICNGKGNSRYRNNATAVLYSRGIV